jgi:hypothetical protein
MLCPLHSISNLAIPPGSLRSLRLLLRTQHSAVVVSSRLVSPGQWSPVSKLQSRQPIPARCIDDSPPAPVCSKTPATDRYGERVCVSECSVVENTSKPCDKDSSAPIPFWPLARNKRSPTRDSHVSAAVPTSWSPLESIAAACLSTSSPIPRPWPAEPALSCPSILLFCAIVPRA